MVDTSQRLFSSLPQLARPKSPRIRLQRHSLYQELQIVLSAQRTLPGFRVVLRHRWARSGPHAHAHLSLHSLEILPSALALEQWQASPQQQPRLNLRRQERAPELREAFRRCTRAPWLQTLPRTT